jgi:TetR/AcrR family fatty acid metabolism transcriptional regulator
MKKGFHFATMEEIATRAGIGKGTVYEYFKSKEDIIFHTADILYEETLNSFLSIYWNEKLTAVEKIKSFLKFQINQSKQCAGMIPIYFDIMSHSHSAYKKAYQGKIQTMFKELGKLIHDILEQGKKNGEFRKDLNSVISAKLIISFLDGVYIHQGLQYNPTELKQAYKELEAMILKCIIK